MTLLTKDTVGHFVTDSADIISPEEMLAIALEVGCPTTVAIEYGTIVTELVVRRMILNAKMTFLAAYGYNTYSFVGGYAVVDSGDDWNGYYVHGTNIETLVNDAYNWLVGVLS